MSKKTINIFKNSLLLKIVNCHLSLQRVIIFLIVEGLAVMLIAKDSSRCWLLKGGVSGNFLI